MAVVPHPSEKNMLRSSFKWASRHEFVPVEETSSDEQGSVPQGFQELLVRLVKAVLINKPLCVYQCLAATLEAELDRRTLWEMQFSQYSRTTPTSSIANDKMPFHLLPSTIEEVGDASDMLPGKPDPRNLTSDLDEQERALVLGCFPNSDKGGIDPKRLKPFLAFEFPNGSEDATRDEIRVASLSVPHHSTSLAVKPEELKHMPEDAVSATASGAIKPVFSEPSKDSSAANMTIDSRVLDSRIENTSLITPTIEFPLRSQLPFATVGDQDELQDSHIHPLGNWHSNSLKGISQNEEIDCTDQNKMGKGQTRENSLHLLDIKPRAVEPRGSGLTCDASDRPSYIPRGDRLADAMSHLNAKAASDLELREDVAAVASTDKYADALNKIFERYFQEPDKSRSWQDSCILPTRHDVPTTASNPGIAVPYETSETTLLQGTTVRKKDSNVVQSRNDLADAGNTDGRRVTHDEPQTTYPEHSSRDEDAPVSYLTSGTEQKCLDSVRALEKQENSSSSSYLESAETDELEYVTPPNESFKQEFQEEDEFHTPRAMFIDDVVVSDDVEMSPRSVHALHDKLLLASYLLEYDEGLTAESGIQEFPQSNESTKSEGVTTQSEAEGFSLDKDTTHDKEINYESVIHDDLSNSDDSSQDEEMTIASVVEGVVHGKESMRDTETYDESRIQELSHHGQTTHDAELTTESVVEGVLHGKESTHNKQTLDESQTEELLHFDESTQNKELTTESVGTGVLHGKESTHDKQTLDESQTEELLHFDESTQDKELTTESVGTGVLHGKESTHDKQTLDESQTEELLHFDESTQDKELTTESVGTGVLHGKESTHDKQTLDESQTEELLHFDESTQDKELTTESVGTGVLLSQKSTHDKQTLDESQTEELSHFDESTQNKELTTESVGTGVLHGKESTHDKQTLDESQTEELSHFDESTQNKELTTESVGTGVLHGKESTHDKQTLDESQTEELLHFDESTQDKELTTESVGTGVLHGKESTHDKQTLDESQTEELLHFDESTQDKELRTESVGTGVLLSQKSTHDKQTLDESQTEEISHFDESTQNKEMTTESVGTEALHGKESTHDKQTLDESQTEELSQFDESTQDKEVLTTESVGIGVLHGKESMHGTQTYEESQIKEISHGGESTQAEELTSKSVIEEFPNVKESTLNKDISDKIFTEELSPDDEKIESDGLKFKTGFQEFPHRAKLIFQDFLQDEESAQNKGLTSATMIQVVSKESVHGKNWMSEEFQSSRGSALSEDLKSKLAVQAFPQDREPTCSNELAPNSVCREETTLYSMQEMQTVNDTSSMNQMTVSSTNESEMQPGSSLDDQVLYESLSGEETDLQASLMVEEMNFELMNDKEAPMNTVIVENRSQKTVSQMEETSESVYDEENPTLENDKLKLPDTTFSEEMTLRVQPDQEMIQESKLGEEIIPEREHTGLKKPDLVYSKYNACETELREEIGRPENSEIKSSDSALSKDITPESLHLEEVPTKLEHGEMKVSDAHYSKDVTPGSLLYEVIQPESENSEVRITDSVYSRDITSDSPDNKDAAAEDLLAKTQPTSECVIETMNPDENAITVRPVNEPLLYGQNIFPNNLYASESEFPSVANKPTMSEEKTAYMLEWDEMNLDRRESDATLHKQFTSSENTEQDDIFPEKEELEPSVTESESDTEGTSQPSLEVAVDHPDCFSNFSMGPLSGREARIRLKWYSISTSCSDVLEEEDEEDETNIARSPLTFRDEAIHEGDRISETLLQDDDSLYGKELRQNQEEESMVFHLTKSELTNEMVSANDSLDKNVLSDFKNVCETDAAMFPSSASRQELTLENDDRSLYKSVELAEGSTNSRVLPENSESLAVKMGTKIAGEDLGSHTSDKKMNTSDNLYLSETFTGETRMIEETKEMEDNESNSMVEEHEVLEEPYQLKSAWNVDPGDEIQVDETKANEKHRAEDETEDEAEKARVLADTKDLQMVTEVIDDKFTTVKTELTDDYSNNTEFIQLMNDAIVKAGSCEEMSTPDKVNETKSMHKADIDDALCLVETETLEKEMTNTVHSRDTEGLEVTNGDIHNSTETNKEDVLGMVATVSSFSHEKVETSAFDETGKREGMIEIPANEFQSTGMPEIQRDMAGNAEDSRSFYLAEETDEPELQRISFQPGSLLTAAKFIARSTEEREPEESNGAFESSSNVTHISPSQNWFARSVGRLSATDCSLAHFQSVDKDSEDIDVIQEFKKGADFPATEVTNLNSDKSQGMPAERYYYETIIPEKVTIFHAEAPGQSGMDSESLSSRNETKEESAVEGQGEEISPVNPTYIQNDGEAKDEQEHITMLHEEAPIILASSSVHSHADIDEPNFIDEGDGFFYEEPDRDQQESEPKSLPAHPQQAATDSEEMDVIREMKDYGEYFSTHPSTRSQWEVPFEEDEIIMPQNVHVCSAPPILRYHGQNDSDSKTEKVDSYFGEEANTGLDTSEETSGEEDESAVNDRHFNAPEDYPTDASGTPLDLSKTDDEKKLNDESQNDEALTSMNEPLEHEKTSEWPPLPEFLTSAEENTTATRRPSVRYNDNEWPGINMLNYSETPASDLEDSDSGEEASIYWTEPVTVKPHKADSVSRRNPLDYSDVAPEAYNNRVNDSSDTNNNERLRALFNAQAPDSEDWPPIPEFAVLPNESDSSMRRRNAICGAESITIATEDRTNVGDLSKLSENQLTDSSENWPPLPDFIMEELIFGRQGRLSLSLEPQEFSSTSRAALPSTGPTDKDEAMSAYLNEDNVDDQKVDEHLELSVVNQLVLDIVSSAKHSVQELNERENLATVESTPSEKGITSELKASTWDFGMETPLLLSEDQIAVNDAAFDLPDSNYEEASIYWTQPPTILKPPVADSVSPQSSPDNVAPESGPESACKLTGPQNNEAGFEVRQFCAVASSAFTDLTKVTGSQSDMKSHHNIQSHIELGITACQSWSDLDILPCGSSKSLQLIGAPEMSSWATTGSDEANRKWREDEQVGRRQVAEAESQSVNTEGEAIKKLIESEGVDSGHKIQATEEALLGCHRDSMCIENEGEGHDSSVHIWMPSEEDGLHEDATSKGAVAKGSEVMSSPMELGEKASEQQYSNGAEAVMALRGTDGPSDAVSPESNVVTETVPIFVPMDTSTVMESPDTDDSEKESNKGVPEEYDFGAVFSSSALLTGRNVSGPKQENIFAGTLDIAEPSGSTNSEIDLSSGIQPQKNDTEMRSRKLEDTDEDDVSLGLTPDRIEAQQEAVIKSARASDEMTGLQELLIPQEPLALPNQVSCSLCKTDRAALSGYPDTASTPLSEPADWFQTGHTWFVEDEMLTSVDPTCRRNELLGAEEENKCLSSSSSTLIAAGERTIGEHQEIHFSLTVDEEVKLVDSASLTQPASSERDKIGANSQSTSTISLSDTNFHISYSPPVVEMEDSMVGLHQDDWVQDEVDEEVQPAVSTGMDASLTQPVSLENDKIGASSESASTITLSDANSHLSSPQVVEVRDSIVGLDQDDWVQDELDEDMLDVQGLHLLPNETTSDRRMENKMFFDTSRPGIEQQHSFDTTSVQLDLNNPDVSSVLGLGDRMEETHKSGLYSPDVNLDLVDEEIVTGVKESDVLFTQEMPFPVSSGAEPSSLADRFMAVCPRTSSNQLESEAVDNSSPSGFLPGKGEDEGQLKNQVVGEEQLSVSSSDFLKCLTPEFSPMFHGVKDVEPKPENLKLEDRMQDLSASQIRGESIVASEGSPTIVSDVMKEEDISGQYEDLGNVQVKNLDKDHGSDPNKHHKEGIHTENENKLDEHQRGLDENHDKDRDKNDNEDQGRNCAKDVDNDYIENQVTSPDMHQGKDHDENRAKKHDKDHDLDRDYREDHDIDHNSLEDIGKQLGLVEVSTTEGTDEYVQPIPPHSTKSETDLVFSLHENHAEHHLDLDVEPLDNGSTNPIVTAGKDVTIIPVDVLDQTPRSQSPSVNPAFCIASQHVGLKIINLGEQDTIKSSITEIEGESQEVTEEKNETEQNLSYDAQKTYFETPSSKADNGTVAFKTAEGIVSSDIDVTETDDDNVVPKSDETTFAAKTIEGTFILKVGDTRASDTKGDTVVSNAMDGACSSQTGEGTVVSESHSLNASKADYKTDSSDAEERLLASQTAEVECNASDERKVMKTDDQTAEPVDSVTVVAAEIDIRTEDDGTVSPNP